jgi:hypothetical protein
MTARLLEQTASVDSANPNGAKLGRELAQVLVDHASAACIAVT